MLVIINTLLVGGVAYLIGSISFSLLITRLAIGADVRQFGSGHAGATNTMRAVGWWAGVLVMLLDLAKGFLVIKLAQSWGLWHWTPVLAAALVVIGHCWPIFAGFRGGMGLASAGGVMLGLSPLGLTVGIGVAVLAQLVVRHSARANFVTGLLIGPVWLLFPPLAGNWLPVLATGLIVALRSLSDWNRVYKELWLDREVESPKKAG